MEALTRLVADSLARHGLDSPVDPRRLQWSSWFRCDSPRSLLFVPSKPGIFAIAEEAAALGGIPEPRTRKSEGNGASVAPEREDSLHRRLLAVLQFSEDDDMAYVLDRMFTYANPMRSRLHSGSCFVRFVVVEDQHQRRSICAALNQWMRNSAEKASGLPADFSSSLEFTKSDGADRIERTPLVTGSDRASSVSARLAIPSRIDSGAESNLHCPPPFPSGF
jgi:hypothetical protein